MMELYTERRGMRAPREKTCLIDREIYDILLRCCKRYQKNVTHLFPLNCHHDFTDSDYVAFDETGFSARMKIRIPSLFRNKSGDISVPEDDGYDQYALLDFMEYLAQNMRDIRERWNSERYRNYQTIDCLPSSEIFGTFQEEINGIFADAGLLYELTDDKKVERIVEYSPLTEEMETCFEQVREEGTRELLKDAAALYKSPGPTARRGAVEKLWDALERLKTYYTDRDKQRSAEKIVQDMAGGNGDFAHLLDLEFHALTAIGNSYRIRHHETDKIELTDDRHWDYLFNRCLSLVALAITYLSQGAADGSL